ncbi:FkbM family methyltransferase [Pendulispora brunnea]|uniref:FkbM family methyltransferase n=1 Tax=Pendulispora brunnea TaxID=2905690 RepID=A0ABZ2KHD0_9BACT
MHLPSFQNPAWRKAPVRTSLRVAASLVRKRVPFLRRTVVAYDGGRSRVAVDLSTALGLTLYRYPYREPEIELLARLLAPGDTFIDGGANIGLFTLVAASRVGPHGKVVAFEPASTTRSRLANNATLSGFSWIDIRSTALSDAEGELELVVFDGDGAGLSSFSPANTGGGRRETVRIVTLDSALADIDPTRLRAIKLDLEGAEHAALRGAHETLSKARPDLVLELEPEHLARQGTNAAAVTGLLRSHGYELFRVVWDHGDRLALRRYAEGPHAHPNVFATCNVPRIEAHGIHRL